VAGYKMVKASDDAKAAVRTILFTDEVKAIKALNWRHPILIGSKLLTVFFLFLSWPLIGHQSFEMQYGFAIPQYIAVPVVFGCMLVNIWYLHVYVAGGGFDGHDWHKERTRCSVAIGLLFVGCCIGASGKFREPMMDAGTALSWLGLITMGVSVFGAWTKEQEAVAGTLTGAAAVVEGEFATMPNQSAHVKHNPMFDATAAGNASVTAGSVKQAGSAASTKKKGSTKTPSATSAAKITVSLKTPFGIGLEGDDTTGIKVFTLKEGKAADKTGKIKVGMKIISINGNSTKGLAKEEVSQLIKDCKGVGEVPVVLQAAKKKSSTKKKPSVKKGSK